MKRGMKHLATGIKSVSCCRLIAILCFPSFTLA